MSSYCWGRGQRGIGRNITRGPAVSANHYCYLVRNVIGYQLLLIQMFSKDRNIKLREEECSRTENFILLLVNNITKTAKSKLY